MLEMFQGCENIKSLDLSKFDTSKVTDISSMFKNSMNLETIYLSSSFNTKNVKDMSSLFQGCEKI